MDLPGLIQLLKDAFPILLQGAGYTLFLALASMLGGLLIAILLVIIRLSKLPVLAQLSAVYVSCIRGTPLLVQLFVIYFGLPSIGIQFEPLAAGVLALSLNVGAYLSETLRGSINGITQGQWDAGKSLGLTNSQTLRYVVAPQALRLAVPSLSNSLISLIKDTSLVSVISVSELMLASKEVIATTFQPFPLYLAAAAIYWAMSASFEGIQRKLEERLNKMYIR
ncbi:amino acid ABC transporter permease [Iodobacter fluviatilis]|uniref:Putative glutamine transport system permease protein GlnP n=1 Tax=Iodobacter fluviatilis TaxID=537 RepID=A0A377Q6Y9_9NEIS|nr:amino acid ABC transporter permease [Iodobacter fluviatilis]TCU90574.1 amino acid ABC transporter membrane protein (PAAT family) [Iodobacter fluviatilis]STQ89601.1 Inner membrane amino-acid ABC transporter permease protein yecS [Iodobacter fluviatilis]